MFDLGVLEAEEAELLEADHVLENARPQRIRGKVELAEIDQFGEKGTLIGGEEAVVEMKDLELGQRAEVERELVREARGDAY